MNILSEILGAQGVDILGQLGKQFGLGEEQTRAAITGLLPALTEGLKKNMSTKKGLDDLLGALKKGNHRRYVEQPDILSTPASTKEGNDILGHIFGNKDVSRNATSNASATTGIDLGILKKMLPVVAAVLMGSLGKKSANDGMLSGATANNDVLGGLTSFIDLDKDGSIADELLMFAKKLFF